MSSRSQDTEVGGVRAARDVPLTLE